RAAPFCNAHHQSIAVGLGGPVAYRRRLARQCGELRPNRFARFLSRTARADERFFSRLRAFAIFARHWSSPVRMIGEVIREDLTDK
ncbi:hypothetical protein, partial [Caballeronia glebae]|uniref:hypothetical protein n=1 Tax=Caballeronia glebae TaxID=1777143 RepID=UPI0038BBEF75